MSKAKREKVLTFLKLRTTFKEISFEATLKAVQRTCDTYAYCHEGGEENPHAHWYLETYRTPATVRLHLRKLKEGNEFYSMNELDERYPLEYLSYMTKEGNFNFDLLPEEIIAKAKARQEEVLNEIKEKKKKKKKVLDLIEEKVLADIPKDDFKSSIVLERIVPIVTSYYINSGQVVRPLAIEQVTLTLYLKYSPHGQREFVNSVCQRVTNLLSSFK